MGLYDRPYYQNESRGVWLGGRSIVIQLILINVALWLADVVSDGKLSGWFALQADLWQAPWQFWQLLTYGFMHDYHGVMHILFNMYGLWLFGTDLEAIYGRTEFLRFYLATIVFAGFIWVVIQTLQGAGHALVGASAGIMGLMILFVLNFPRRIFYIWGIVPLPAWALGVIYVLFDVLAIGSSDNVAHVAHLSGVAFGFLYFRSGWNLGRIVPRGIPWPSFKPKLKIHDPETEARDLGEQVDRILEKISRSGESSLTKQERDTLERASRRYQRRRS